MVLGFAGLERGATIPRLDFSGNVVNFCKFPGSKASVYVTSVLGQALLGLRAVIAVLAVVVVPDIVCSSAVRIPVMDYSFERLRFHFVEHASRQVWHEGNAAVTVMDNLQRELNRELTEEEVLTVKDQVQSLCSEADKLLRGQIPHQFPSRNRAFELWGYQQIQPLHPDVYIHQEQPSQTDLDNHFALPEGEVWRWNVVHTFTGPYFGIQTDASGQPATRWVDLGPLDFVMQTAEVLKDFPGCELLGDLTLDNIDMFTLEPDECSKICQALREKQSAITQALGKLIQGDDAQQHAKALLNTWQIPLQAAQQNGIAQFKRGKAIQTVDYSEAIT
jgi:hypothetical protein